MDQPWGLNWRGGAALVVGGEASARRETFNGASGHRGEGRGDDDNFHLNSLYTRLSLRYLSPSSLYPPAGGTTRKPPPSAPYTCVLWSVTFVSAISRFANCMEGGGGGPPPSPSVLATHAAPSNRGPACQVAGCSLMKTPGGMRKAVMSAADGKRWVFPKCDMRNDGGGMEKNGRAMAAGSVSPFSSFYLHTTCRRGHGQVPWRPRRIQGCQALRDPGVEGDAVEGQGRAGRQGHDVQAGRARGAVARGVCFGDSAGDGEGEVGVVGWAVGGAVGGRADDLVGLVKVDEGKKTCGLSLSLSLSPPLSLLPAQRVQTLPESGRPLAEWWARSFQSCAVEFPVYAPQMKK